MCCSADPDYFNVVFAFIMITREGGLKKELRTRLGELKKYLKRRLGELPK